MTTHPTDGDLRAYLDGEAPAEDAGVIRRHLEGCAPCASRAAELRSAEGLVSTALEGLDPAIDAEGARAQVREKLAGGGRRRTRPAARWSLARAALLILALAGGAAAAIPGSPVRAWLGEALERIGGESPAPAPASGEDELAGVRVEPSAGAVRVVLLGAGPGTRIRVRLVERTAAAVFAGRGTRFGTGPGSVEARLEGDEARVEIPRAALLATVTVNGSVFFRKTTEGVELPGPVQDTVESEFRFRLPGGEDG